MKKFLALLIAISMLLTFVACTSDTANREENETNSSKNDTLSDTEQIENSPENDESSTTAATEEPEGEVKITFTEVIVVDNEDCMIKITGIDPDNLWGYTLNAQLENKSSEKTYMFSIENASINGVQCNPLFATDVAAGKKANEDINFLDSEMEDMEIGDYTDIELTFRVYDSDDWSADDLANETVHIYPYGEEQAVKFVRQSQPTDQVIIDNEYITVIVTGYEYDDIWGYNVNLFLLNKTDTNVMFSVDDASINGFMAEPLFATSVSAGKCAFDSITWFDTTLEENGITEIEEIEFNFRAYDMEDWSADDFANEVITLNP